ncbi:MAG: PhzF family phenazine biosynthesis isomerase [Acidobacteria bacterium]|nr:PhzF family phenazine biosynthesis isomerase [Acidobacteriota bacterium]
MTLTCYIVDAFTDTAFHGNPAAVVPLDSWLPDDLLQSMAAEHNLAETVYFVQRPDGYDIRWFTPKTEVDLCGHATLASGFVIEQFSFFAPAQGVPEDPVTGSAHSTLIPYWAKRLGKNELRAKQISERGGDLFCGLAGDRVKIGGRAVLYSKNEIYLG